MDNVETSALRTMMEVCENPDVRQGIQCALNFIEVSGYYNLTDWEAMSEEEQKEDVLNYMRDCPKRDQKSGTSLTLLPSNMRLCSQIPKRKHLKN